MSANREKLLADLDRIRILETSFPWHGERKTHYLLTYTPKDIPIADEQYQLTCTEIVDLIEGLYEYVKNSRPVAKKRGDGSLPTKEGGAK